MNSIRKSILIGLAVIGMGSASLSAYAQAPAAQEGRAQLTQEQRAAKFAERKAKRAERMAQRQAKLHDSLRLTSAQEGAWRDYLAAIKPEQRGERPRMDREAFRSMSAPQRMEMRIAMQKQRTARMESRLAATKAFYAQLTAEQRKTFDDAMKMKRHHGKRGHFGHRGGHHGQHGMKHDAAKQN
ncbi:Spy/CpxP family protein refolding chaperone [Pseudoduganella sp. GCM10020061]|uniref:Spy/CpxP family protein refolding chaperone n=1 Tax=Pseudoduganella sp. GCM10020061 TaxID=3317345 RepID=UPI00362C7721